MECGLPSSGGENPTESLTVTKNHQVSTSEGNNKKSSSIDQHQISSDDKTRDGVEDDDSSCEVLFEKPNSDHLNVHHVENDLGDSEIDEVHKADQEEGKSATPNADTVDDSTEPEIIYTYEPMKWTPQEDVKLKEAIKKFGQQQWKLIAQYVGTRDSAQCVQRWTRSLRPGLVKGRWSTEEDKTLTRLVRSYPDVYLVPWKSLVDHIPGRTSKQCRERWFNFLDPSLKRTGHWSKAEDAKLWQLSQTYGRKWSQIARELPGRTENGVKVRYNALDRNFKRLGEVPTAPVAEESTQNDEANSSNSSAASVNSSSTPARQTTTMASLVSPTPITNTTSQEANLNSKTTTTLTAMLPPVSYSSNMLTNAVKNSPPLLSSNPFLGSLGGVVDSSNTASNKKRDREDEVDVSQETCVSLPGKKISALPTPLSIQFLNSSGFGSVALPLTSTSVGANGFVNNSTVSYLSQSPILSAPSLLQQYDRPNSSSQATSTTSGTAVSQSTGSVSKTPGSCTSSNALLQQALYSQLQTQAQLTQQSIPQATFVSSYNPAAIAQVLHQQREVQQVQSQIEQLHSQLAQLQQLQQLQQMKYLQTAMQLQQQQMMILPTGLNMNGGVPGFPSSLGMGQLPSSISSNNGAFVVSGMQQIDPATLAQFSWPTNFQG